MKKENILQLISDWKTELISSVVILLCLSLSVSFPTQGSLQIFSNAFFFLFLLPVLYIKIILKQDLADFGLNLQNKSLGLLWGVSMLVVSFLVIFFLIHFYKFEQNYLIPAYLAQNFWSFLFYELALVNFLLFIQEFFFKGFFLFLFTQRFGLWSIFLQTLLFVLFINITQGLHWQITPMLILSVTGGFVTYKSKSFIYSYVMSLFFLIILDAYIIYLFK